MDRNSDSSRPAGNARPETVSIQVLAGGTEALVARTRRLIGVSPFVLVARSSLAARFLLEQLDPSHHSRPVGAGDADLPESSVLLYDLAAPPARRREALDAFANRRVAGIVACPVSLVDGPLLSAVSAVGRVHWIVQDAHALSLESSRFVPELVRIQDLTRHPGTASLLLQVSPDAPRARAVVEALLGTESAVAEASDGNIDRVRVRCLFVDEAGRSRTALRQALERVPGLSTTGRCIFLASDDGWGHDRLPANELASLAEEMGFQVVGGGEIGTGAGPVSWCKGLTEPRAALLSSDPEVLQCVPPGLPTLVVRLTPPGSIDEVIEECRCLAGRGGGIWTYVGPASGGRGWPIGPDLVRSIAEYVLEHCAGDRPVPVSLEAVWSHLGIEAPLEEAAPALERVFQAFVGAGFLRAVRRAYFLLEVADAHRFGSPHIDIDPRYVALHERYSAALAAMDMLESVEFRLESRLAKDLRVFSRTLGYSVGELNDLFSDMSSDGIVPCRLYFSGAEGNIDLEVQGAGDFEAMRGKLEEAVQGVRAWLERYLEGGYEVVRRLAEVGGAPGGGVLSLPSWVEVVTSEASSGEGEGRSLVEPGEAGTVAGVGEEELSATLRAFQEALKGLEEGEQDRAWGRLLDAVWALDEDEVGRALEWAGGASDVVGLTRLVAVRVALLAAHGDPNEAAGLLEASLGRGVDSPVAGLLTGLLNTIDYRVRVSEGFGGDMPEAVRRAALVLPALESVPAEEVAEIVRGLGFEGEVESLGLGQVSLVVGGHRWLLERQTIEPETEARLWLRVASQPVDGIEPAVALARLSEAFLMVVGLSDRALCQELARRVVEERQASAAMHPVRRTVARARALVELGRSDEALELLDTLSDPEGVGASEVLHARTVALLERGEALEALTLLVDRLPSGRTSVQARGLFAAAVGALEARCEAEEGCSACSLLGSVFCPSGGEILTLVGEDPFGEPDQALETRLRKRTDLGTGTCSVDALTQVLNRFGNSLEESLVQAWMAKAESSDAKAWLTLARKLLRHGRPGLALEAAERVVVEPEDHGTRWRLARILVAAGGLSRALTIGVELDGAGARVWSPVQFCRDLASAFGEDWGDRVDELGEGLDAGSLALLRRLAEEERVRRRLATTRERLEALLNRGSWRELPRVLDEYRSQGGEAAERDPAVREALQRLAARKRRVEARVRQLLGERKRRGWRAEMSRLARDAELLGLEEAAARASEALAAAGSAGREGPGAGRSVEGRGRTVSDRDGARSKVSRRGEGGRSRRDGSEAVEGGQGKSGPGPRQTFKDEAALLAALGDAPGDRQRLRMTMPLLEDLLERDPKRGLKLLRDAMPVFHHADVLDRPLSRLIRRGLPPDEQLPRLRRLLEGHRAGHGFTSALNEIGSREHPEPWKQVLAQLKLKQ